MKAGPASGWVRVLSVRGRTGERVVYDEAKVRERWAQLVGQWRAGSVGNETNAVSQRSATSRGDADSPNMA